MLEKIGKYIPPALKANKTYRYFLRGHLFCRHYGYKRCLYYVYNSFRLRKFKDIHKGQRCFIIGTGPSLNQTNLSLIKDEIIMGVNTLYIGLSKFGITCKYYAVCDGIVWQNQSRNILGVDATLFLSGGAAIDYLSNISYFKKFEKHKPLVIEAVGPLKDSGSFSKDILEGLYDGATVITDVCLQVAYYMGFKEVYLLGCDCDYSGAHRFDGSISDNPEGKGISGQWQHVFNTYEICKKVYEEDGREIINATVGGKLEVFKRKRLEDII